MFSETKIQGDFVPFVYAATALHKESCVGSDNVGAVAIAAAQKAVAYSKNGVAVAQEEQACAQACSVRGIAVAQAGNARNLEGVAIAVPSGILAAHAEGRYVIAIGENAYGEVRDGQIGLVLQGARIRAQDGAFIILENGLSAPSLIKVAPKAFVRMFAACAVSSVKCHVGDPHLPFVGYWNAKWRFYPSAEEALVDWNSEREP